jgi:hypothetical protein
VARELVRVIGVCGRDKGVGRAKCPSPCKEMFFSSPFLDNIYNFSNKITKVLAILK